MLLDARDTVVEADAKIAVAGCIGNCRVRLRCLLGIVSAVLSARHSDGNYLDGGWWC
jgi:hypothetical protein